MYRTIGVLGGGQLGRMMALAGYPLGVQCLFYDPSSEACAGHVAPLLAYPYEDTHALSQLAARCEVITYEFENVPVESARWLAERVPVRPTPEALHAFQDRLMEKQTLQAHGVPVPTFAPIDPQNPRTALEVVGLPAVIKTRRFGYDGKGQAVVKTESEFVEAVARFGAHLLIAEAFVPFEREVSIIAVRGLDGTFAFYPLVENHHREGILYRSIAPAPNITPALQQQAERHARALMEALDYVGVMTIEWFECNGQLLANEVAPRVHNSGHWTIEGAHTSQFENHLRAILGLPLGSTAPKGYMVMQNILGDLPDPAKVLSHPRAKLHLYGKAPKPKRKLGHITWCFDTPEERERFLSEALH
ncbi:MAG: 5-(carboxyamino)imidazole ribonucleotide synthase [Armatimonadetes bacterium]|nr:5-(carboxyamino)imidazole ribonucleotide synthase [Armatimonadota bacterium]CUU34448.1 5-(carboxyamino)imidazole ribonucleotide synthase [Armatimonadetes bacterium DC]